MEVTASGQDVRKAQKYLTLLLVKGPSVLQLVPPCSHLLTLPILFTSPRHPSSPSPSPTPPSLQAHFSRNLPETTPPVNSQRALGLPSLRCLTTSCLCACITCQRLPSAGSRGLVLGICVEPRDMPSPAHHQPRATHNVHLTQMHD